MLHDKCDTCNEVEAFCVCEDCSICFNKVYNHRGHRCLSNNERISESICFDYDGHCKPCADIPDVEVDEEELKRIDDKKGN